MTHLQPLLIHLPGHEQFAESLAPTLGAEIWKGSIRSFPDGEHLVRIDSPVAGRDVLILSSLDHPNRKLIPLYLLASTARELGARRVVLMAPYLAYMRQDERFHPGEGLSSRDFARLLSSFLDGVVTLDPHLHRIHDLGELFSTPTHVAHAAPCIAAWIQHKVKPPFLLVGPDSESAQWVEPVAKLLDAPWVALEKTRHGDRDVSIDASQLARWSGLQPIIIDDIISTGETMIEATRHLKDAAFSAPICIGIHPLFSGDALTRLRDSFVSEIISTNSIPHPTNGIDISELFAKATLQHLQSL